MPAEHFREVFPKGANRSRLFRPTRLLLGQSGDWDVEPLFQCEEHIVEIKTVKVHGLEPVEFIIRVNELGRQAALGRKRSPQLKPPLLLYWRGSHSFTERCICHHLTLTNESAPSRSAADLMTHEPCEPKENHHAHPHLDI